MSGDDDDFYDELTTLYCHIIAEAAGWELTTEELNQVGISYINFSVK